MKIELYVNGYHAGETEVDTSPGSIFEALELIERLGTQWDFQLEPTRDWFTPQTVLNVRLVP